MNINFKKNWTSGNNSYSLTGRKIEKYISCLPSQRQIKQSENPFYCFIHFGMNTSTGREWGTSQETVDDFKITKIKVSQWVKAIKSSCATGIILTCKHHDGFCLWDTKQTDFNVMNTAFGKDIVKLLSDECHKNNMRFGVYLSPWDMHDKRYATPAYNDYFCAQLTELLTNYGDIFEVWFDGAKGAGAKSFDYDWKRYYSVVRSLQPEANIAICGPDIRWVGNEAGKARKSEYCVVPSYLRMAETVANDSQHSESDAKRLKKLTSSDEDLGSRKVLEKCSEICWYPAEVDVSIRRGWFYPGGGTATVKSASKLFKIYLTSVGNNSYLLLNVPPNKRGVISLKETRVLKRLGDKIKRITQRPIIEQSFGTLNDDNGYLEFKFDSPKKLRYAVIKEDIAYGQRVEKFDLYIKKANGKYKKAYSSTIIGMRKIIKLHATASGAVLVIRQSRCAPVIKQVAFYE